MTTGTPNDTTAMRSLPLRDFISQHFFAACRVAVTNDGSGTIFIIRTQSGAEHFFSVVDCTTQEGDHYYAAGPEIMERLGALRRVILL